MGLKVYVCQYVNMWFYIAMRSSEVIYIVLGHVYIYRFYGTIHTSICSYEDMYIVPSIVNMVGYVYMLWNNIIMLGAIG